MRVRLTRRVKHIALKEVRHILRDPRSLTIAIVLPVLLTVLFGYAINLDVKHIRLAVVDLDRTYDSRDLADRFYTSGYFTRPARPPATGDPEAMLRRGSADAVLTIMPGFARAAATATPYQLGLVVDGADANLAAAATSYASIIVGQANQDRLPAGMDFPRVVLSARILYNPDLKSADFFVPGIIAILLMLISTLLTSITIAREKETGTMEQLLVTPVAPGEVIIGKVLPYIALAFLDAILVIAFAVFHFGVPFAGSVALLAGFGLIFIVAALSAGILISTLVNTQQVAMMTTQLLTVLPSVMLSGFIFDLRNMPRVLQLVSYVVPARYFQVIIRGIMLKGTGLRVLWAQGAFLAILTLVLLAIAARRFRLKIG
ncbi:MAG TPA: ABC transporter permease [bacterium]|nr:ABC transporter permease [bacterium]